MLLENARAKNIELDFCPRCQLLWFDTGEWQDLEGAHRLRQTMGKSVTELNMKAYADSLVQLEKEAAAGAKESVTSADGAGWHKITLALLGLPTEEDSDKFGEFPPLSAPFSRSAILSATIEVSRPVRIPSRESSSTNPRPLR